MSATRGVVQATPTLVMVTESQGACPLTHEIVSHSEARGLRLADRSGPESGPAFTCRSRAAEDSLPGTRRTKMSAKPAAKANGVGTPNKEF